MSLGIAFKGAEGIVLAADSRVTLTVLVPPQAAGNPQQVITSSYDNATKLLTVQGQQFVGAVTYGVGAIGQQQPRTAHSYIPEFESELASKGVGRLSVTDFASELSNFFAAQWTANKMPATDDMVFFVGGYDENAPYGRIFEISIPSAPEPKEWHDNGFGLVWGGQRETVERLMSGFDHQLIGQVTNHLSLSQAQVLGLETHLKQNLQAPIPFQFLPLQDCVDLCILLLRTTIGLQTFQIGVRGVGGAIDLATITRTLGLNWIQTKKISGELS